MEQFGVLYPTPPSSPPHRHASLFPFRQDSWNKVKQEAEASGCSKVLISNEDLSITGIKDEWLDGIRSTFPEFSVSFIIYVRRIDDACKEWYMQSVKRDNMLTTSYESYVDKLLASKSCRLFPTRLLKRCEKQVGKSNLIIRQYDKETLLNGNTVDDLFAILGIGLPDSFDRSRHYNPGIPQEALPLLTDTLRQYQINDPTRVDIYNKIITAFKARQSAPLPSNLLPAVEEEINRLDAAFLPGYKDLFEREELNLKFSYADISPQELLTIDLLYAILFELRKKENKRFRLAQSYDERIAPALTKVSPALAAFVHRLAKFFYRK